MTHPPQIHGPFHHELPLCHSQLFKGTIVIVFRHSILLRRRLASDYKHILC
jgi:hypothetical protein